MSKGINNLNPTAPRTWFQLGRDPREIVAGVVISDGHPADCDGHPTVTPTGSLQMPSANLQTPSVALQPTTVTPTIDLQKSPAGGTVYTDKEITITDQETVTLHPNGPPTVDKQLIVTPTPKPTPPAGRQHAADEPRVHWG
jgi:hypothetical protein